MLDYTARIPSSHDVGGDVMNHNTASTNRRVGADGDARANRRISTNPTVRAYAYWTSKLGTLLPLGRDNRMGSCVNLRGCCGK